MVDPQAHLAAERIHAVIPPREGPLRLLEQPECVLQPESDQLAERFAFRRAEEHLPFPGLGVVDVAILGRDVEITQNREPRVA
jgi:hypothetical protein